jgi:hypothetical protein
MGNVNPETRFVLGFGDFLQGTSENSNRSFLRFLIIVLLFEF